MPAPKLATLSAPYGAGLGPSQRRLVASVCMCIKALLYTILIFNEQFLLSSLTTYTSIIASKLLTVNDFFKIFVVFLQQIFILKF